MLSASTRPSRFIPQPAAVFWSAIAGVLLPGIIACKMVWIINPYGRSGDLLSAGRRAMPILGSESCTFCLILDSPEAADRIVIERQQSSLL